MKKEEAFFSVIFLAGGRGQRMRLELPKQYALLEGKPLALHSFDVFACMNEVAEIVVVCDTAYQPLFKEANRLGKKLLFALPGPRRQDSVFNGLQQLEKPEWVCIHDAARPFIDSEKVLQVVFEARQYGCAVLGVKAKSTLKLCTSEGVVEQTLDRDRLWEIQTPQVVAFELLREGFENVNRTGLTVTDDASLVELLGRPVKVVEGFYRNLKVTVPEDLAYAEKLLKSADGWA